MLHSPALSLELRRLRTRVRVKVFTVDWAENQISAAWTLTSQAPLFFSRQTTDRTLTQCVLLSEVRGSLVPKLREMTAARNVPMSLMYRTAQGDYQRHAQG